MRLNPCHKCGSDDVRLYWITVDGQPCMPSAECAECDYGIEGLQRYASDELLIKAITTAWNERNPMSYPELTPEEKAKRLKIAELRAQIKELAAKRRLIKSVYRMPHGTDEHKKAMADARVTLFINPAYVYPWNAHCTPGRNDWRGDTHWAHLQLAELTGKPHVHEPLPAAV